MNRFKGYLNEVGKKSLSNASRGSKGYLNEVGEKQLAVQGILTGLKGI